MTKQIKLFPKQRDIREILMDMENGILELLIGGGAGGAKTFTGCLWVITMCLNFPGIRAGIGRSKLKTLRTTTLRTLTGILTKYFNFKEGFHYKITGSNDTTRPNTLIFADFIGGSEIVLVDLKHYPSLDPDFDDLGSLELTIGFIDEVAQLTKKAYIVFSSRIGRRKNDQYGIVGRLLMSCNPGKNRVYGDFFKPQRDGTIESHKMFFPVLGIDNPNIEAGYLYKLSIMPDGPMKQRLYYGNRDYEEDANKIYAFRDLKSMFTNTGKKGEKYMIVDVAGAGRDESIVTIRDGRTVIDYETEAKSTPESLKAIMFRLGAKHEVKRQNWLYDGSGLGRGLSGLECQIFLGASSPIVPEDASEQEQDSIKKAYMNLRAQCFLMLQTWIKSGDISLSCIDGELQDKITEELDAIQLWKIEKDGPTQIIPKEEIKKLIGRSPDRADTISMRVYFELLQESEPNFF